MRLFQPDTRQRRTMGALFAISFVIAILLTAFFQTQVVSGEQYAVRSEENRLRPVVIPAPRGTIVDRNGEIVATSIPGFSVMLLPGDEETILGTLRDLAPFLGLAELDLERLLKQRNGRPHDLLVVTEDATFAQVASLEERRTSFPNLLVVDRPKRYYPAGEALGPLIGYVAEISREELVLRQYRELGYRQGRWIGKAGVERQYESRLSGQDGARFVEVDAMGRIINPRSPVGVLPPTPGRPLKLTLDLGLQQYIHEIFPDTLKGAVVALVPSTGEILALYSHPTYDPNDFVGGPSSRLWRALSQDTMKPLLNRATAALYPPASTFKTVTAAIGVKSGILKADTRMPISCAGGMFYAGRYARCWKTRGHGSLTLAQAIEESCNVYFYQVGIQLGLAEFAAEGTRMGFSAQTGLDLPNEKPGIFPTGRDWYKARFGFEPTPSEVMSLAIGQGPNSQTVLRQTYFYSAIAGNGSAPEPHLVTEAASGEGGLDLGMTPEQLADLWGGLGLVTEQGGTALQSSLARYKLYGKTGTAQNPHGGDHAWFVGFAGLPGGNPEIALGVIVEHGLHGDAAAPLAAKAVNFYLDRVHGHPFDPEPTLGERWRQESGWWGWDPPGRVLVPFGAKSIPPPQPTTTEGGR